MEGYDRKWSIRLGRARLGSATQLWVWVLFLPFLTLLHFIISFVIILQICAFCWLACQESLRQSKDWCFHSCPFSVLIKCLHCRCFPNILWMSDKEVTFLYLSPKISFHLGKPAFQALMRLKCSSFPAFSEQASYLFLWFVKLAVVFLYFLVSLAFLTSRFMEKSLTLRLWTCERKMTV